MLLCVCVCVGRVGTGVPVLNEIIYVNINRSGAEKNVGLQKFFNSVENEVNYFSWEREERYWYSYKTVH